MTRHHALPLFVVLLGASLFAGCATTTTTPNGPTSCAMPQRAQHGTHHERSAEVAALRGNAVTRVFDLAGPSGDVSGIPTPEPARPVQDPQMAGPTPQVPIPVSGGLAGQPAW